MLDTYFWGPNIESAIPDLLNNLKENADCNMSVISYTGYDAGDYNDNGGHLINLFLMVETIAPANIAGLLA